MNKLVNYFQRIIVITAALCLLGNVLLPATASASLFDGSKQAACDATATSTSAGCSADTSQANSLLATVINIFSMVVAVIAVIMVIIGGIRYVVSQGESSAVSSAKNTIIYALVGLVIVAFAQLIVHFVIYRVTTSSSATTSLPKCPAGKKQIKKAGDCTP